MIDIKTILAKSSGVNIQTHSELVQKVAISIAKSANENLEIKFPEILEAIRLGSLLHDIGKCTTHFQKKIKSKNPDEENLEIKSKFRHNEIGWAFLSRNLFLPQNILDMVLDLVYWHHGISNEMCKHTDLEIEDTLTNEDKEMMMYYLKTVVDETCIKEKTIRPLKTPKYYYDNIEEEYKNTKNTFSRACLVSADRIVSSVEWKNLSEEEINTLVLDKVKREVDIDIKTHIYHGNERFDIQLDIINSIGKTTIVKAPAGFGKTLIGLLRSLSISKKKLIWVCPRNMIASSVYKSILEELSNFESNDISVELFLRNEVVARNKNLKDDFSSDIIITNIDNYLAPSVDNRLSDRLYTILSADVVFDEYHELIGQTPLCACFLNLMRVRHQMTDSETVLLSATPSCMEFLWESESVDNTIILPNKFTHYPAQHNNKYLLNFVDSLQIKKPGDKNLLILNSVTNAQNACKKIEYNILIHSYFEDDDRKNLTEKIYKNYGKNSDLSLKTPDVIGTHILQASLDISFKNLYESILSPETTIQRIGRCDRWGNFIELCTLNILFYSDKGEDMMRDILYTKNLSYKWAEYLSKFNGQSLTLNEIYCIYNKYTEENKKILQRHLSNVSQTSLTALSELYPKKFYIKKTKGGKEVFTAGGNKLRSSGNEIFVIAEKHNQSGQYSSPFTVQYYNKDEFFNEVMNSNSLLLKKMKSIRNEADERFDYNEMVNSGKIDFKVYGRKSNTPHIRPGVTYHKTLGLISEDKLLFD
jgi:CRISPR-associated endonuclease Cas3-HD